jgi:hypothetical protein
MKEIWAFIFSSRSPNRKLSATYDEGVMQPDIQRGGSALQPADWNKDGFPQIRRRRSRRPVSAQSSSGGGRSPGAEGGESEEREDTRDGGVLEMRWAVEER